MSALPRQPEAELSGYDALRIYVASRVERAMADLARRHPRLTPREKNGRVCGTRKEPVMKSIPLLDEKTGRQKKDKRGNPRVQWVPSGRTKDVPAHEPVREVNWGLTGPRERRAELRLNVAMRMFAEGKVGLGVVKLEYKRFAEAHTYWWLHMTRVPAPGTEPDF